jgi:hypothetical protein
MKELITITVAGVLIWWVAVWPIQELRAEPNIHTMIFKPRVPKPPL